MSEDVNSEDEVDPSYSGVSGCPIALLASVEPAAAALATDAIKNGKVLLVIHLKNNDEESFAHIFDQYIKNSNASKKKH